MTVPPATVTALEPEALRDWVSQHEDLVVLDVRSEAEFNRRAPAPAPIVVASDGPYRRHSSSVSSSAS